MTAPRSESAMNMGKVPPNDQNAEQGVLGGMLLSKDAIADVVAVLSADDFYVPKNEHVYEVILDLYARGEPADAITVTAELGRRGLANEDTPNYIHDLVSGVPTAANAGYYAAIVAEKAVLRRLINAGTDIVGLGHASVDSDDIPGVVDRAEAKLYEVTNRRETEDYSAIEQLVEPVMDRIDFLQHNGAAEGVMSGFTDLDEVTNGFKAGQMIIVAARPGVGKSTFGLDVLRHCAVKQNLPCMLFSLEMSKEEVMMRLMSAEASINLGQIRGAKLTDSEWASLARRMGEVNDAPLYIDDSPSLTLTEMRAKARRLKQKKGLNLIVIDYLQLMSSGKKVESRQQEVSEFSRQMKLLAKELEVPLIAIAQLNRGPEQRNDKRPQVSDLRESGSLEQDADMVMLLHRPGEADESVPEGEALLILGKHRGGPTKNINLAEQMHYSRFANLARSFQTPG